MPEKKPKYPNTREAFAFFVETDYNAIWCISPCEDDVDCAKVEAPCGTAVHLKKPDYLALRAALDKFFKLA